MNNIVNKQQQRHMFLTGAISFSIIFAILGAIIFFTFQHSLYSSADRNLQHEAHGLKAEGLMPNPGDFRTMTLLFNETGAIVNFNALGDRATPLAQIKMDRKHLNVIQNVDLGGRAYFRTMLVKLKNPVTDGVQTAHYALLLENISAERQSVESFLQVLLVSFAIFALLTIGVSWWLAQRNMRPVIKAWQQQQDFVDSAAHELKTPLTIIQGKLEILLTKPSATIQEQFDPIIMSLSEIRRLNNLSADLLTLAKANSNMTVVKSEAVELAEFFQQVVEPYGEIAELEQKNFTSDLQATGTTMVDKQRIHQLLVILLDNALKYTDEGQAIQFKTAITNKQLMIEVADTGRGISANGKKHIFDRFYRDEKSGSRDTGGTGLGLAIAKWIFDSHQGKITVSDNLPQGTRFVVTLPLKWDRLDG